MNSTFEAMGGTYRQEGDYLLPNVEAPEIPAIGIWGQRRHKYLMEHNHALYTALFLGGKLTAHLLLSFFLLLLRSPAAAP